MRRFLTLFTVSAMTLSSAYLSAADEKPKKDNTEQNERDRDGDTKTPPDQSNKPEDLKLTQTIRQAVVKDDTLSITAKNIKIITVAGEVTLRGPVNSEAEKTAIDKHAKTAAGDAKVVNQLEVNK